MTACAQFLRKTCSRPCPREFSETLRRSSRQITSARRIHSGRRIFVVVRAHRFFAGHRVAGFDSRARTARMGRGASGKEHDAGRRRAVRVCAQSFIYRYAGHRRGPGNRVAPMGIRRAVRRGFSADLLASGRTRGTAPPQSVPRLRRLRAACSATAAAIFRQQFETFSMVYLQKEPGVSSAPWVSRRCHRTFLESLAINVPLSCLEPPKFELPPNMQAAAQSVTWCQSLSGAVSLSWKATRWQVSLDPFLRFDGEGFSTIR
jgi:hypothetical protein